MTGPVVAKDLLGLLACPVDRLPVEVADDRTLMCRAGHRFPLLDGVPVMLHPDDELTMAGANRSKALASAPADAEGWYLESLGLSDDEKLGVVELSRCGGAIDPVVAYLVAATNGLMYRHLIGTLDRYPIPPLPLPPGEGRRLLDVGCSWGRWSLAAADAGYRVVGVDPSLGAVMAARRVARELGVPNHYVVGDARHLPFRGEVFDVAYSYSVLQHLSKREAGRAVSEMGRALVIGGMAKVQMPGRLGVRCLYHQARRAFREGEGFEVRYWGLTELRRLFGDAVGSTRILADGYFGIGLQPSDRALMSPSLRAVLWMSERLTAFSRIAPLFVWVADSVFVESHRTG